MTEIDKLAFRYRAKLIIDNLSNCNSGADNHFVANMKQTAHGILDVLDAGGSELDGQIESILSKLEQSQLEFFKKKFQSVGQPQTQVKPGETITQTQTQQIERD